MSSDRQQTFKQRQLDKLTDEQLKERFWQLTNQIVKPIVELAKTHTSPSIERSILLRMGIDSVSSHGVVQRILDAGLLGKGAGHVLLKLAQRQNIDVRAAAQLILDDASVLTGLFKS
ncbi:MAG TPA: D-ornithine 4,5-aminomutase subunit OraS [Myxococcota bacterium]|jgi:D-ornithine 4,5-aminomutase subunit alpha|nr:ornithine aminomutase subunit alpha [Myxococcota bacterium]OQC34961.1 MAG: D-ornithine 4,5-aminomutase subunit alpha [Deltaproteobacteria bacterium ADurb.Bin058]HHW97008.1 ornithine aminomutase [Oligoflexales bacterium]MBP8971260.1 ornithine aminomutase subunit alpha [Myxococcota bacterium]HOE82192.1 D-ornithine 4,5-aminomutase subunit OraS [Myxococcota bacterium]